MDSGSRHCAARKRPSQVLRACWECKRRKMHQLSQPSGSGDESSLGGMGSSGSTDGEQHPCPLHIGERLSKLEQLFEKFVCRRFASIPSSPSSTLNLSRSPTIAGPDSDEKPKSLFGILPEIKTESHSISTVGEKIVHWQATQEDPTAQISTWTSTPSTRALADRPDKSECDSARRGLVALLPSQHDSDVIFGSTNSWTIFESAYKPSRALYVNQDPRSYALDMSAVAKEPTVVIARTLLHLAICIGSLPPEFDSTRLNHIWSLNTTAENYVNAVSSFVSVADEMVCTLPGLETLLLLTVYQIQSANLRQAWLICRRAVNLAQLMGFHRIIRKPKINPPIEAIEGAKILWRSIVDVETYLGLHLRLPFASEEYPCEEGGDARMIHRAELVMLSRQISQLDGTITPQTYVHALSLDEKLESLMKQLSKEWWEVPSMPSTARSEEAAMVLQRLVQQIWHLELKIFVHLPFLLRAQYESRYEYSKITGLQASRNIIMRWFALRNAAVTQTCCRFAELGVFIATVTIGLDILIDMATKEKSVVQRTRGSDFAMVCRVVREMEKLSQGSSREKFAARSAVVIKKLLWALDPNRRTEGSGRLTIPYFGTIEIAFHKPPMRPAF
ncbi:uncharacterized protein EI97DRAFT_434967, partial [Westerdykella ornata]